MFKKTCPVCGEGKLTLVRSSQFFEYRGYSDWLTFHYKVCDCCKSEIGESDDLKFNKKQSIEFKQSIDHFIGC